MSTVMVKVVGFSDTERHSLNTIFRLSSRRDPSYVLWTSEMQGPPHIAVIDLESYEGGLELASPSLNPNLKVITVGISAPEAAWHALVRPVDWVALVGVLDGLFASVGEVDFDLSEGTAPDHVAPPGVTVCLVVGLSRDERLYLRARLALGGLTELDEADTAVQASYLISVRHYDLVIVSLELSGADPWSLVKTLKDLSNPPRSVVVATESPTWAVMEHADGAGCAGLLDIPFNPRQVVSLLQKI